MKTKLRGFTLIELMIAVTIVGSLAAVAVPTYREHILKSKRNEAQGALVTFANAMEQWRLQCGNYCGAATASPTCVTSCASGSIGTPTIFLPAVPINVTAASTSKTYDLTISAVTTTTYTLRATPVGSQASDGYLDLRSDGTKLCQNASSCLNGASW